MIQTITKELTNKINQKIACKIWFKHKIREEFNVYELHGKSAVGTPYTFDITFVSKYPLAIEEYADIDVKCLIKDENSITNSQRYIYGKTITISEDSIVGSSYLTKYMYKITIVHPFYYLGLNKRYEIYHEKKVSTIINEIISRYAGLLNIKLDDKIDKSTNPIREYTTQYNQSDLEFITMLALEEGYSLVYHQSEDNKDYFEKHPYVITLCELNEHCKTISNTALVSFNKSKSFKPSFMIDDYYDSNYPSLDYQSNIGRELDTEILLDNNSTNQLKSVLGVYKHRVNLNILKESKIQDLQRYNKNDSISSFAQSRNITGSSQEIFLHDSLCVELYDEKGANSLKVIIIECTYDITSPNALEEQIEDTKITKLQFEMNIQTAVLKEMTYKPPHYKNKPKIHAVVTAIVSSGVPNVEDHANEIDVDEKGRIRVLFSFEENHKTSCYVRLASFYSGDGYGALFLPRVNSEVIVSFINGNIDKPIIIGSLYNGENKLPYNLPKEKTKSYIRTHSIPAHDEQFGYNEILFEDKRGEEVLSFRAQKDFKIHTNNSQTMLVKHDMETIIRNDENITIKNNKNETIGNDSKRLIQGNNIKVVQKEEIHTIKEDKELHVLKDFNTIVKHNQNTIIENNLTTRVKGKLIQYVHKDGKHKYLKNLFLQVGKDFRIDVSNAYHLKANNIKNTTGIYEIIASKGISLKCGASILTVNPSGIYLNAPNVDKYSSNKGVNAIAVPKIEIKRPYYNKIRVIKLDVNISKQNTLEETLIFTASVEVYEKDVWVVKKELNQTQISQLNWVFIKNNDTKDRDILTDNPMDDSITEDGLIMSVNIQDDNIYKYAHVHCYVADSQKEGYVTSELKRYVEVMDIKNDYINNEEGQCTAILNIDEPRSDELEQIRWIIEDKVKAKYNGKEIIQHNIKDENVREINFKAYIDGNPDKAVLVILIYDEKEKEEEKTKKEAKEKEKKTPQSQRNSQIINGSTNEDVSSKKDEYEMEG